MGDARPGSSRHSVRNNSGGSHRSPRLRRTRRRRRRSALTTIRWRPESASTSCVSWLRSSEINGSISRGALTDPLIIWSAVKVCLLQPSSRVCLASQRIRMRGGVRTRPVDSARRLRTSAMLLIFSIGPGCAKHPSQQLTDSGCAPTGQPPLVSLEHPSKFRHQDRIDRSQTAQAERH